MDSRIEKLAKTLVNYSMKVQKGEHVLVSRDGNTAQPLIQSIIREIYAAGGYPHLDIRDTTLRREIMKGCSDEQLEMMFKHQLAQMQDMDCYVAVRAQDNTSEESDVDPAQMSRYMKNYRPVLNYRINKTRWVVLRYPNNAMAQLANTSLENFEDFYFQVCNLDYSKMSKAMDSLVSYMEKTEKVRIVSPGTDLTFSIKDIPVIKCDGGLNIPDGEVYTAPVKDSMNGTISYNTPSIEDGFTFENIVFEIKDGKIVKATANNTDRINELLDTDAGARYFGEFAIGVNPYVLKPMKDTLFDEKIAGSIHLTPGNSYEDAFNGNESAVHWDLVLIQRPEYGGGEIYFDDKLIRKDGLFVVPELECLNPENLK